MPLKPRELGERLHIDTFPGALGFPGWQGMVREGDPAAIPDTALWRAQNVRLRGREYTSRGGQVKVNTLSAGTFDIQGFFDASDID